MTVYFAGIVYFISIAVIFILNRKKSVISYKDFSTHRKFLMGFAVVLIVVFHSVLYNSLNTDSRMVQAIADFICFDFNIGVEIFLLVSGIGLYYSFSKGSISFRKYYLKRVLNVYLIALIIDLPYIIYTDLIFENKGFLYAISEWTGLLNWSGESRIAWYVVFVMILYAVYPLIFKALKATEKSKYSFIYILLFYIVWVMLCFAMNKTIPEIYSVIEIAVTRVPIFIIGCYIGQLVYNKAQFTMKTYITCIAGIAIYVLLRSISGSLLSQRLSHCLISFVLCIIVLAIIQFLKLYKTSFYKAQCFIGNMSLEIYLIHMAGVLILQMNNCCSYISYYAMIAAVVPISIGVSKLRNIIVKKYVSGIKGRK